MQGLRCPPTPAFLPVSSSAAMRRRLPRPSCLRGPLGPENEWSDLTTADAEAMHRGPLLRSFLPCRRGHSGHG
eukprot:1325371-Pyramimonas_sp.AAC.1